MDNSPKTLNFRDFPRQLWAGLCLIGLLLGLALAPIAPPPTARSQANFDCADVTEIPQIECQALVALYQSTGGPNWPVSWLHNNTPCSWYGITCGAGRIIELSLIGFCADPFCGEYIYLDLTGELPPEIGDFSKLQTLDLGTNQLSGGIPAEIGNLTELRILNLGFNHLAGSIPPEIGNLTRLRTLNLQDNQLSGSIPPEIGNLTILSFLYLSNNQLTSLPHEIGNLTILANLGLSNNQIGSLPPGIGNLANLHGFGLDDNLLANLPPEIGRLSNLTVLALSNNRIAALPPEIGNLNNLDSLVLSNNQLSSLPAELSSLPRLSSLNLSYNRLMLADPCLSPFFTRIGLIWAETQTVPPVDLHVASAVSGTLEVAWTPIPFSSGPGFYELSMADNPSGPYTVLGTTQDKTSARFQFYRQPEQPTTYLRIRTFSAADGRLNDLWSEYSPPLAILTAPVSPENEVNLAYMDEAGRLNQVDLPAGTFAENGTLYFGVQSGADLPLNQTFAWQAISLGINHASGYADDLRLPNPFTLTMGYLDSCLPEANLNLLYWEAGASQWVPATDTCSPPGAFSQNLETNQIELAACQLGTYALAASQSILYLPMVATPYEGH